MRHRRVIGGASAAALLGFDGFRGQAWPLVWSAPHTSRPAPNVFRTRNWREPLLVGEHLVAHPAVVLRQLGMQYVDLEGRDDRLCAPDRIELATEHALRAAMVNLTELRPGGGGNIGDRTLATVLGRRGDEPPTESYAETRAVQAFRSWGWQCWRQLPVVDGSRIVQRVDFVLPFGEYGRRPPLITADTGLLIEIDGRQFHDGTFEQDHKRQSNYDRLGLHWISLTPTQIEHGGQRTRLAIDGALRRAQRGILPMQPNSRAMQPN